MDAEGWLRLLRRMESGEIEVLARDLPAPSPLAAEALNARPYAFLDDAPLEERRTQAVQNRRYVDPESADDLGQLDAEAIDAVREEAWPRARSADEMHEALHGARRGHRRRGRGQRRLAGLAAGAGAGDRRATRLRRRRAAPGGGPVGRGRALGAGRARCIPMPRCSRAIEPPSGMRARPEHADDALRELLRSRLRGLGPVTAAALAASLRLPRADIEAALSRLAGRRLRAAGPLHARRARRVEWCERHLLARIHRYTLEAAAARDRAGRAARLRALPVRVAARRRRQPRSAAPRRWPASWRSSKATKRRPALWEAELLPARVKDYAPAWLDDLCTAGRTLWTRLRPAAGEGRPGGGSLSLRATPILLLPRRSAALWTGLAPAPANDDGLGSRAQRVAAFLAAHGASFFDEIVQGTHLLGTELEDALSELVMRGRAHCDSYAGLRALLVPPSKRSSTHARRRRRTAAASASRTRGAGRWSAQRAPAAAGAPARAAQRGRRAGRPHPAAPLRRGLLAPARARGRLAAAVARPGARLPPARGARRDPRRPLHRRRGGRTVRPARSHRPACGRLRRQPLDGALVCLAAADPANLLGTVVPGPKVARVAGSRVLYRDGVPIADLVAGQVELLQALTPSLAQAAHRALMSEGPSRLAELVSQQAWAGLARLA